jgi:hypothetical protein
MGRGWEFVRFISNKDGVYTCKDCGTPLKSVMEYKSPKGRKTKIVGTCPTKQCAFEGFQLDHE